MHNWTLRAAKTYVINELRAAEQSELQALRHLRNAGEEWIKIKQELGDRGLNIADWCKTHMPVKSPVARPSRGARQRLAEIPERKEMG